METELFGDLVASMVFGARSIDDASDRADADLWRVVLLLVLANHSGFIVRIASRHSPKHYH
jgi:hypothetical protein